MRNETLGVALSLSMVACPRTLIGVYCQSSHFFVCSIVAHESWAAVLLKLAITTNESVKYLVLK
jgi:hypothetical protein